MHWDNGRKKWRTVRFISDKSLIGQRKHPACRQPFGSICKRPSAAFFWHTRALSRQNSYALWCFQQCQQETEVGQTRPKLSFRPMAIIIVSLRRTSSIIACIYGRISVIKAVDFISLFLLEVTTNLVISWRILRTTEPSTNPCSHGFKTCCRLLEKPAK
jgi:hypothetical protein